MPDIPVNRIGVIKESKDPNEKGWYVKVVDDSKNTGGFLIFTSSTPEFAKWGEVFDSWVEKKNAIQTFFEKAGWRVKWAADVGMQGQQSK